MIAAAQKIEWHPMFVDLFEQPICSRFLIVIPEQKGYRCISKENTWNLKNVGLYELLIGLYTTNTGNHIRKSLMTGYDLVMDFYYQRVSLQMNAQSLIDDSENVDLPANLLITKGNGTKVNNSFAHHLIRNKIRMKEPIYQIAEEKPVASNNVVILSQWKRQAGIPC